MFHCYVWLPEGNHQANGFGWNCSVLLHWYSRSALVWFKCHSLQKWAGFPLTLRNKMKSTRAHSRVVDSEQTCSFLFVKVHLCKHAENWWRMLNIKMIYVSPHVATLGKFKSIRSPKKFSKPDKSRPLLELDPGVSNNPLRIRRLELFHHHHHPPFWKRSMRPKYPQMPRCKKKHHGSIPLCIHSVVLRTIVFGFSPVPRPVKAFAFKNAIVFQHI